VHAVEYLVPFSNDSTAAPKDSSTLDGSFSVGFSQECLPSPQGCFILDFEHRTDLPCDAVGPPGGTACIAVTLLNDAPVGGLQSVIDVFDPRVDPNANSPLPGSVLHAVSAEVTERAAGFQVAWTTDESRTRLLLYSTSGATIQPGQGPILRVCYDIGSETPEGVYFLQLNDPIVADPGGNALPQCPTLIPTQNGRLCVARPGCDLNGDGHSDILDVIQLVQCALQPGTEACPDTVAARADCNADSSVDIRDVICCVRKILAGSGFGSGGGEPGDFTGAARIGFTGPARWVTPIEGRAVIEVQPGPAFGGVQFKLQGIGSARIHSLSLRKPSSGYRLETSVDAGGATARAILYTEGSDLATSATIDIELDSSGAGNGGTLELTQVRAGTSSAHAMAALITSPTADVPPHEVPGAPIVLAARPNPFAGETEIAFALPTPGRVTIRVYAATGRLVRTLVDAPMPAGVNRARWDGRDAAGHRAASGIYFFKFSAEGLEKTARLIKLQ
jgi:hypothetical protein